jgi:probable rRNA maturation factor
VTVDENAERSAGPVELVVEIEAGAWPPVSELDALTRRAVAASFAELGLSPEPNPELSLTFTDDAHIASLNALWRGKDGPTNVLSFPLIQLRPGVPLPPMLGDIVVAFETVSREAEDQDKPFIAHLAHLLVHGLLHLLGYDHMDDDEAETMESLERRILERLAIPDPYA